VTPRGRRVVPPNGIRRFYALCEQCPQPHAQTFYSEDERNRFAFEHAMTFRHRLTLSEETIPCRT
jgi:hypothetical protein